MSTTPSRLALLLVAFLATPAAADDIFLRDGREVLGVVIREESFSKVEYRRKSVTQKVDTNEILRIEYGRTSDEFKAGLAALASGDSLGAAHAFLDAAEDEDLDAHIRATAYAECGDALLASNNFTDAVGIFDELLTTFRDTRHYARALLGKGRGLFLNRQLTESVGVFKTLQQEVQAKGLGEHWGMEAEFALLWAEEAQGKKDVLERYLDLQGRARGSYPEVANQCALRIGRVYLANDDVDKALPLFEEIVDSRLSTEAAIVAGAFNGRGRCLFWQAQNDLAKAREASAKKDSRADTYREDALENFEQARLDFLRVQTVYRGVVREQPEALYWAAQAFLNVAAMDDTEEDAERWGKILLKRCSDAYPQSEWGSKAKAEL